MVAARTTSTTEEEKPSDDSSQQRLIKELQTQVKDAEKARDREREEYAQKLQQRQKDWDKDKKKLQTRLATVQHLSVWNPCIYETSRWFPFKSITERSATSDR